MFCKYLNETDNTYVADGCSVTKVTSDDVTCSCSHMSTFIVTNEKVASPSSNSVVISVGLGVGLGVGIPVLSFLLLLLLILVPLCARKRRREKEREKNWDNIEMKDLVDDAAVSPHPRRNSRKTNSTINHPSMMSVQYVFPTSF